MERREVLSNLNFGGRVAEEEGPELASYFVETDQWNRVFSGEVDVIYGPKGSGKSAIYSLIKAKSPELLRRGISVLPLENVRANSVFAKVRPDSASTEAEFRGMWKAILLIELGKFFRRNQIGGKEATLLLRLLEEVGLLAIGKDMRGRLRQISRSVSSFFRPQILEPTLKFDPQTGAVQGISCKVTLREDGMSTNKDFVSLDELLCQADKALIGIGKHIWFTLDRLDSEFAPPVDLETSALKGLFRVYVDLRPLGNIHLKIFLRTDIWKRVTSQTGFREASHITKSITLSWNTNSLLNLILRRALQSKNLKEYYDIDERILLGSLEQQVSLFYKILDPLEGFSRLPSLNWIVSRTTDGSGNAAPREVILFLNLGTNNSKWSKLGFLGLLRGADNRRSFEFCYAIGVERTF